MRVVHSRKRFLPLNEASEEFLGYQIDFSTWYRWAHRGCGPDGHKLPLTKIGGRVFVARDDLEDWLARINGRPTGPRRRTSKQAKRSQRRSMRELKRAGIV